jgi:type III secretory pathway component EscS
MIIRTSKKNANLSFNITSIQDIALNEIYKILVFYSPTLPFGAFASDLVLNFAEKLTQKL